LWKECAIEKKGFWFKKELYQNPCHDSSQYEVLMLYDTAIKTAITHAIFASASTSVVKEHNH